MHLRETFYVEHETIGGEMKLERRLKLLMWLAVFNGKLSCPSVTYMTYWWDSPSPWFHNSYAKLLSRHVANRILFSFSEIHRAATHRPERIHSHSHRRFDVLPWLPRILRSHPRVSMFAVIGKPNFISCDQWRSLECWHFPSPAIRCYFDMACVHRPWHFRGTLLCKCSILSNALSLRTRKN